MIFKSVTEIFYTFFKKDLGEFLCSLYILQMTTNNSSKFSKKFHCEKCNYFCNKKGDYNKHLQSIKHKNNEILKDIPSQTRFYFCHSYFFEPDEPQDIMTQTNYDKKFCSGINRKNIFGIQFHPEKSLKSGQILMKNFSNL